MTTIPGDDAAPTAAEVQLPPRHLVGALDLLAAPGTESVRVDALVGALRVSAYDPDIGVWTSVMAAGTAGAGDGTDTRRPDTTVPLADLRRAVTESPGYPDAVIPVRVDADGVAVGDARIGPVASVPAVPESPDTVRVPLEFPPEGPSVVTVGGETRLVVDEGVTRRFRAAGARGARAFTRDGEWFLSTSRRPDLGSPVLVAQVASYAEGTE